MTLRLYNTLTRRPEGFEPLRPGEVSIYTCGPTVYRYVHLGNLRSYLLADLLRRALAYRGLRVRHVKNITDVGHLTDELFDRGEDKMLVAAQLEEKTPQEIGRAYTVAFHADEAALNILPATVYPRASDHIPEMIAVIEELRRRGFAYVHAGTVYFEVSRFPAYGRLSGNTLAAVRGGHRSAVDAAKRHHADFVLWKDAGPRRLMAWPSPWGRGYPGWHIECSAMSLKHLGVPFDIHTGGIDNVFPHHEDEIAQTEGATGVTPARYWVHGEHLLFAGAKMAKSAANFARITEVAERGFDPLAFRYLCLTARYRKKLNFTWEGLAGADRTLRRLRARVREWEGAGAGALGHDARARAESLEAAFGAALEDDLDFPRALQVARTAQGDGALPPAMRRDLLLRWDAVLGLDLARTEAPAGELPAGAQGLLAARKQARDARDWRRADALRDELARLGLEVVDTSEGQRWSVSPGRHERVSARSSRSGCARIEAEPEPERKD